MVSRRIFNLLVGRERVHFSPNPSPRLGTVLPDQHTLAAQPLRYSHRPAICTSVAGTRTRTTLTTLTNYMGKVANNDDGSHEGDIDYTHHVKVTQK